MPEVKICGLCRAEDARVAAEAGADWLGVVFAAGPRRQDEASALRIWAGLDRGRAGVFADARESDLLRAADRLRLSMIQLHGSESPEECRRAREAGPWRVWKAIRIRGDELEEMIARYAGAVDAVLVEAFDARGLGGTGAPLARDVVARARRAWPVGLGLVAAGGLTPESVADVVRRLEPDVVDVSSGVEARVGAKDAERVRAFVRNAKAAGRERGARREGRAS